jgi:hypothetical protein
LGILVVAPSGQMPGGRTSLSLDASLAIPTRVLRFEISQRTWIPSPPDEPPVLALWLNQGTRLFLGEPPQTSRTRCSLHANPTYDLAATIVPSSLVLVLSSKPTKPRVQTPVVSHYPAPAHLQNFVLLFLPPCGPHLISFDQWIHQAEPTCLHSSEATQA